MSGNRAAKETHLISEKINQEFIPMGDILTMMIWNWSWCHSAARWGGWLVGEVSSKGEKKPKD